MQNRFVVVASAALCAVGTVGCSSEPANSKQPRGSLAARTAQVTVNGKALEPTHAVDCHQDGWTHTIQTGDQKSGVTLVVNTGDTITAKSVVIVNVGGFNGSYYENHIGDVDNASIIGTTFQVSGTAEGATTDDPNQRTTASFEIKANC